ncbi:TPA: pantetheine-phosphate adenylyltransferase [Streptococcus suis]
MTEKIAIFPGSFDPMTFGHLDLIERGAKLFDQLIVLVAVNTTKNSLFSPNERVDLVKAAVSHLDNVQVQSFSDGLVATYYQEVGACAILRGVRNALDFEYESSIAIINRTQYADFETVLMYAREEYRYLSSSLIKEIAHFNGDISKMVPAHVAAALEAKYRERAKS